MHLALCYVMLPSEVTPLHQASTNAKFPETKIHWKRPCWRYPRNTVACKIQLRNEKINRKKLCQGVRINWCQAGADMPLIRGSSSRAVDVSYARTGEGIDIETRKTFPLYTP